MSAEVTILRGHRQNVLTVPSRAVKTRGGPDRLLRQSDETVWNVEPFRVRHATHNLQEVLDGLSEGEEVVVDPPTASLPGLLGRGWLILRRAGPGRSRWPRRRSRRPVLARRAAIRSPVLILPARLLVPRRPMSRPIAIHHHDERRHEDRTDEERVQQDSQTQREAELAE